MALSGLVASSQDGLELTPPASEILNAGIKGYTSPDYFTSSIATLRDTPLQS